ncbi:hypothetical protein E2C01_049085 [Portunus trituberculatus]|uniref:Uncharacterized protein n=1 Tax=Portunus trituberculatus TaxID=210409 RepID=A0A5B7GF38_PORTR|nr:hypothetical protein [Portunus trituberculatus]
MSLDLVSLNLLAIELQISWRIYLSISLLCTLSVSHELVNGSFLLSHYALLPWMARRIFCQLCPTHGS